MAEKAKHAHGSRANLNAAIESNKIDAYDVLFLSGEDESPAIGWVDRDGNPIIISPADEVSKLETKINAELATKVSDSDVDTKVDSAVSNAMTDIDERIGEIVAEKIAEVEASYEIIEF